MGQKKGWKPSIEWRKKRSKYMKLHSPSKRAEVRKKISESQKGKNNSMYGKRFKLTEEQKRKQRDGRKGYKCSDETKRKISIAKKGTVVSEATRKKLSIAGKGRTSAKGMLGKKHSKITKKIMSNLQIGKNNSMYGISNPKFYSKRFKYKGYCFRSSWEYEVAKKFDDLNIIWKYEPIRFFFNHEKYTYTPDFYLPEFDIWIEVKGWMRQKDKDKLGDFLIPERNFILIDSRNYKEFLQRGVLA